jgi:dihydrofolate synthase/folylpolyglutamate synthase
MNILGHTLGEIAAEKAGIVRDPLHRVTLAPQPNEAMIVLKERCALFGIRPMVVGQDLPCRIHQVSAQGVSFDVQGRRPYDGLVSPMTGVHQAQNAALAIAMAEDLEMFGFVITEASVREGVASVRWPARFEHVNLSPTVIVDCAHTIESARALVETFCSAYPQRKAVVVVGMSSDKDHQGFIRTLEPVTQSIVFAKAAHPRSSDLPCAVSVVEALRQAQGLAGDAGLVLVTGSVFVCAEARTACTRAKR